MRMRPHVIVILGCTATGKGALARELARRLGGEILSIDSMKIYRGMDIGTAKPPAEERREIPHHMIDIVDAWEGFSAARFVEGADAVVAAVAGRGRPVIAVGGTVLYFRMFHEGLFDGPSADAEIRAEIRSRAAEIGFEALHAELTAIDPASAARIHRNDIRRVERALEVFRITGRPISELQGQWDRGATRRPDWKWTLIGLRREKEDASRRINERVRRMMVEGLVDEALRIWRDPRGVSDQARQAVGYAELFAHFEGRLSEADAVERIKINSRQLAKNQRTWLRRLSHVHWIDLSAQSLPTDALPRALELAEAAQDES